MNTPSILYVGDKPTRIWLKVENRRSHPTPPNTKPVWEFDDTGVLKVLVAEDGMSAAVTPVGVGHATVEVTEGPPDRPKREKTGAVKSSWPHGAASYVSHDFEVRPADGHALTLNVGMPGENIPQAVVEQAKAA